MSYIFPHSQFNGDISRWDVSKVENMIAVFHESHFNGDISDTTRECVTLSQG